MSSQPRADQPRAPPAFGTGNAPVAGGRSRTVPLGVDLACAEQERIGRCHHQRKLFFAAMVPILFGRWVESRRDRFTIVALSGGKQNIPGMDNALLADQERVGD